MSPDTVYRLGPFQIDTKISLGTAVTFLMAAAVIIGGFYTQRANLAFDETRITVLENSRRDDLKTMDKISDTLKTTNEVLGQVEQALDDKGIHVRASAQ